jgi:hypothetical protein
LDKLVGVIGNKVRGDDLETLGVVGDLLVEQLTLIRFHALHM